MRAYTVFLHLIISKNEMKYMANPYTDAIPTLRISFSIDAQALGYGFYKKGGRSSAPYNTCLKNLAASSGQTAHSSCI